MKSASVSAIDCISVGPRSRSGRGSVPAVNSPGNNSPKMINERIAGLVGSHARRNA